MVVQVRLGLHVYFSDTHFEHIEHIYQTSSFFLGKKDPKDNPIFIIPSCKDSSFCLLTLRRYVQRHFIARIDCITYNKCLLTNYLERKMAQPYKKRAITIDAAVTL